MPQFLVLLHLLRLSLPQRLQSFCSTCPDAVIVDRQIVRLDKPVESAHLLIELLVVLEALGGEAKEAEIVFGVLFFFLYEIIVLLVVELHRLQLLLFGEAALLLVGDHFEREGGDDDARRPLLKRASELEAQEDAWTQSLRTSRFAKAPTRPTSVGATLSLSFSLTLRRQDTPHLLDLNPLAPFGRTLLFKKIRLDSRFEL